ncbi:MAG TPA: DUF2911 domain-containing protein [Chitinophagaceae bacterium]
MFKDRSAFLLVIVFTILIACRQKENNATQSVIKKDTPVVKMDDVNPFAPIDISPMDMSYYPVNFPVLKMTGEATGSPVMRVIYSRPHRQGRAIFGKLLKFGEPWRLGANEATEIDFFKDVTIQNTKIHAGRYIIYCIPFPDKWTIVLNSNIFAWGLKIDSAKDIHRFEIPVTKTTSNIEYFTMIFEKANAGAELIMTWDDVMARLPIKFTENNN